MAKRSKRRTARQNKDQAGCMWGFISIFDFRNGRTTRRLLSDRRHETKTIVDPNPEVKLLTSSEEMHITVDVKTSVKELMEEEMIIEQDSTKQTGGDEVTFSDPGNRILEKNNEITEKTLKKPFENNGIDVDQFRDLEDLMKEMLSVYRKRDDRAGDADTGPNRAFSVLKEKLNAAIEVFMNEKSRDRNGPEDFIDAIQMLSSNKELFSKLLQEQNSILEDSKSARSGPLENGPVNRKRNFFRRRSKSHDSISGIGPGPDSPFPSSRIVILKPGTPDDRDFRNQPERNSHFSFMEIKKRLRNAIGKDHRKLIGLEGSNSPWGSPNRDHFYTEKFAKRAERVSKLRESDPNQLEKHKNGDTSQRISNIYIEAKKHLSEMLTGGDEDAELMIDGLPKTLGGIISFPEYNSGSSPRKEVEPGFVTAQMRLDPRGNLGSNHEGQPCSIGVSLEEKSEVPNTIMGGTPLSEKEDTICKDIEKLENREEIEAVDVPCEECSSSGSVNDNEHCEIVEISSEERSPRSSKSDLREENEFSSPTNSSLANKTEEPESTDGENTGRPSPVSVLEPLFSDNEISPSSSVSPHAEASIQPLRIQFEDQETCSRNCTENEESAFEYVEAVLLASDLNWLEFESRWLSSIEILDPSLFQEVEIFSSRPFDDQKLLFDSTNEILNEMCDFYLDFFEFPFVKRKFQPVPIGTDLVNSVWEKIGSCLYNDYPRSLDQLVKEDLGVSGKWMDLCFDTREIVFEIGESVFDDVVDDALLTLVKDRVER